MQSHAVMYVTITIAIYIYIIIIQLIISSYIVLYCTVGLFGVVLLMCGVERMSSCGVLLA